MKITVRRLSGENLTIQLPNSCDLPDSGAEIRLTVRKEQGKRGTLFDVEVPNGSRIFQENLPAPTEDEMAPSLIPLTPPVNSSTPPF